MMAILVANMRIAFLARVEQSVDAAHPARLELAARTGSLVEWA